MKLLMTLHDSINIEMLSTYADGFIIGNHQFGARLTHSFDVEEINHIAKEIKNLNKEVFIQANQMMTDDELSHFSVWLDDLDFSHITGVIVADLGALVLLQEKGLNQKAIYNPETLITNVYDFNFLDQFQVFGVYAAKEITLEDLKKIGSEKKVNMFMVGHGHLSMFYSKRKLVQNYVDFLNEEMALRYRQDLLIIEEHRKEDPHPILEDDAGTHVFRSNVMHAFNQLDTLKTFIDYMVIDTLFKDDYYGALVCEMYQTKNELLKEKIQTEFHETWDEGFFFKKTIYKGKGGEQ